MILRKSDINDINSIMNIIKQAQEYFKLEGIDQWQNNYPNADTIHNDIENGESYVLVKDNNIIATTALSFNGEPTYNSIYEGSWINNGKYATIHRIAVDNNYKELGVAREIIKQVEELSAKEDVHSIKADTHEDNLSMQKMLKKNGFQYCGVIYLEDGSKRVAFEKIL